MSEIVYPKTDGSVLFASELNTDMAYLLNKIALNKMGVNQEDLVFNLYDDLNDVDASNSTHYWLENDKIYFANGFSEFDTGSLDTDTWTGTGGSESGGFLRVQTSTSSSAQTRTLTSNGATKPLNFKSMNEDVVVHIPFGPCVTQGFAGGQNYTGRHTIRIGSTNLYFSQINFASGTSSFPHSNGEMWIFINHSAETATVYVNGVETDESPVDISGETNWHISIEVFSNNSQSGNAQTRTAHDAIRYLKMNEVASLRLNSVSIPSSFSKGINVYDFEAEDGLSEFKLSYNNSVDTTTHDGSLSFLSVVPGTSLVQGMDYTQNIAFNPSSEGYVFPNINNSYVWLIP